jgi:hypothetical protein
MSQHAIEGDDSLRPFERLVETWADGARDAEIERVIRILKNVLRRRGHDVACQRKGDEA